MTSTKLQADLKDVLTPAYTSNVEDVNWNSIEAKKVDQIQVNYLFLDKFFSFSKFIRLLFALIISFGYCGWKIPCIFN